MSSPINMANMIAKALFQPAYQVEQRWENLPHFDLEAALRGAPYMHRLDARSWRAYHDCRILQGPHSAVLIWAAVWLAFDLEDSDEMARLDDQFRMAPERKMR